VHQFGFIYKVYKFVEVLVSRDLWITALFLLGELLCETSACICCY